MAGKHLILDVEATQHLDDRESVSSWVQGAIAAAGQQQLGELSIRLPHAGIDSGPGVSLVAIIAESHVSVHTWPETGRISMDFYSCKPYDHIATEQSFMLHFGVTRQLRRHVVGRAAMGPA